MKSSSALSVLDALIRRLEIALARARMERARIVPTGVEPPSYKVKAEWYMMNWGLDQRYANSLVRPGHTPAEIAAMSWNDLAAIKGMGDKGCALVFRALGKEIPVSSTELSSQD